MIKTVYAGLLGGLVVFLWGVVSHMLLPLGETGIDSLPNEAPVVEAIQAHVPEGGFYFFPAYDHTAEKSPEAMAAWEARYAAGPTGVLVVQPQGGVPLSPAQLLTELLTNILGAFLLALVLSRANVTLFRGAWWGAVLGLFAWLSISASYWNWYAFPSAFVAAEGIDQIVGWFLAGLAMAFLVRKRQVAQKPA